MAKSLIEYYYRQSGFIQKVMDIFTGFRHWVPTARRQYPMADELLILQEKPAAEYLIAGWRRQ